VTTAAAPLDHKPPLSGQFGAEKSKGPDPLPLMGTVAEPIPFPTQALGHAMRGAVEAIAAIAFVPPSMAAASVLSACSLALQGHADVKLPTEQYRPISLFMVSVAESGDRKSTADELAMRAVAVFQRELNETYAAEKAQLAADLDGWNETRKATIAANKSQGREALTEALRSLGPKPSEPMEPVMVARSGTTQGLVKLMEKGRPSIGLMSDEGGSFLGGYGMTDDALLHTISTLSDCWDGKPVQRLTAGEGSSLIYGRRLSVHLMVQPSVAPRLFGSTEAKGQGILSRILPTCPASLAGTRFVDPDRAVEVEHTRQLDGFTYKLGLILNEPLPFDKEKNALVPRYYPLSEEGRRLWWDFYNENEAKVAPGGELEEIKGFVGKIAEQAARIAAVLALFEQGRKIPEIDARIVARAIEIARFYLTEACRMIGVAPVAENVGQAQILSNWLRDTWKENLISIRAICQKGPNQIRKLGSDQIRDVVDVLVRHNHLSPRLPTGGPVNGAHAIDAWRILHPRTGVANG
jgi:hypothetical protein